MRSPRRPGPARGLNQRQSNICSNTESVTLPADNRQRAVRPERPRQAGRPARLDGQPEPNRGARCPVAAPSSPPRWRSPSWSQPSHCRSSSRGGSSPTQWSTSRSLTPVRFPYAHPYWRHRQVPATAPPAPQRELLRRGVPTGPAAPKACRTAASSRTSTRTTGTASVVRLPDGSRILRLEVLDTSDGPDLEVWLSDAPVPEGPAGWHLFDDGHYSSLGELNGNHGNHGNQNHMIPANLDLAGLRSVSIWCNRFNVSSARPSSHPCDHRPAGKRGVGAARAGLGSASCPATSSSQRASSTRPFMLR
jgi:hypothetical protein